MPEFHAEPYLYLAGLTHKAVLVSWGGFYFRVRDRGEGADWKLVDDGDLEHIHPPRRETIGARSEPYGKAHVEVFKASSGELAAFADTTTTNHVWVTGLEPDTEYRYRVIGQRRRVGGGRAAGLGQRPGRAGSHQERASLRQPLSHAPAP